MITKCGYDLIGQFEVPYAAWLKEYYEPLDMHLESLETQYAQRITYLEEFKSLRSEVDSFKQNPERQGSVFFVLMQKRQRLHM